MPQLDSVKVELKVSGVWTDITAYLDLTAGATIHIGRTSPFSAPPPGNLQLTLDNTDGRFTPGRQVLADGTTANPYYGAIVPRAEIRFSWVKGASTYRRFTGFVKGWPATAQGMHPRVPIEATTVDDRLSRVDLDPLIQQDILFDGPAYYWPLNDDADSTTAAETVQGAAMAIIHVADAALAFGADDGPGSANGTAVTFNPTGGGTAGQVLRRTNLPSLTWAGFSVEAWIKTTPSSNNTFLALLTEDQFNGIVFSIGSPSGKAGYYTATFGGSLITPGTAVVTDGAWHHIAASINGSSNMQLYVDGVAQGSALPITEGTGPTMIEVGGGDYFFFGTSHDRFDGDIAQVAIYNYALSATQVGNHYSAGHNWSGETVDQRIARFLTYGGVTGTLDASTVVLGGYPQDGKDLASAIQDAAISEGGGSVVYVDVNGSYRFRNRNSRVPGAVALTLDAQADLDGEAYSSAYDDTQIVNQVVGTRATVTSTPSTFVVDDAASQATYGTISDSFTSYAQDDDDVRFNAQDRLARQRTPAFRVDQLTVDLSTSSTSTIFASVAALDIGSRLEVTGLPLTVAPASTVDVYAEGWTENYTDSGLSITFDTSPADNPPQALYDDATYGRYQCDGQTLNAALTSSATTVVIATTAGKPTFTTTSANYPLKIQVGTERMTLNNAPGGSTSPQTFTGVTRGADGTTAAAQSSGAAVDLAPAVTYAF